MSRTPRVPDSCRKSPSKPKHGKRPPPPENYKNHFLDEISSCLKETEYLATNRKQKSESTKRQSQIPKRSGTTKKSMIPTAKRSVKKEIVPLKETDMDHVFELTGVSGSPSPCTTPQRLRGSAKKPGTPTRSRVTPYSPRRATRKDEELAARARPQEQPRPKRSPSKRRSREEPEPEPVQAPEPEPEQAQQPEVVNDLIVFSDSPVKDDSVGNLIDLSPVPEPPISEDLITLMAPPPEVTTLMDLMKIPETPKKELDESDSLLDFLSPEKKAKSPRAFIHSVLGVDPGDGECVYENEDAVFAFQERLCTIIEVEIVGENGRRAQVFPTKLNDFLHNRDAIADVFEEEDAEHKSDSDTWVAVESQKSEAASPSLSPQVGISSEVEMSPASPAFLSPASEGEGTPEKIDDSPKPRRTTPNRNKEQRRSWIPSPKRITPSVEEKPKEIPVHVRRSPASPISPRRKGFPFDMESPKRSTPRKATPKSLATESPKTTPRSLATEAGTPKKVSPGWNTGTPKRTTPKKTTPKSGALGSTTPKRNHERGTAETGAPAKTTPRKIHLRPGLLEPRQKALENARKEKAKEVEEPVPQVSVQEEPESPKLPFNFDLKEMQRMFHSPAKVSPKMTPPSVETKRMASTLVNGDSSSDSSD